MRYSDIWKGILQPIALPVPTSLLHNKELREIMHYFAPCEIAGGKGTEPWRRRDRFRVGIGKG
jgi:hypothetical protein